MGPAQFQDAFHHRRRGLDLRQASQPDEQVFIEGRPGALDPPLGLAGHRRDPGLKALDRAGRRQGDAQVDRGAQGDAHNPQEGAPRILAQVAQGDAKEPGLHGRSRPSCIRSTRSAKLPASGAWLTKITVLLPLAVQVGKELQDLGRGGGIEIAGGFVRQDHRGIVDQGPGDGGPLHLAAGDLVRFVVQARRQAHLRQPAPRFSPGLGIRDPLEHPGQGHVFRQGQQGQQIKGLEHHPHLIPPEAGEFRLL